jgi:DNA-binding phage protein
MQFNIQHYRDFMDEFVEEAIEDGDPALLMRLYVAATSLEGITNSDIASRADRMTQRLHKALDSVFKRIHQNGEHI